MFKKLLFLAVLAPSVAFGGGPYNRQCDPYNNNGQYQLLMQMQQQQNQNRQKALDDLGNMTRVMRQQRLDREFMSWPDKSPQGVLNFSRQNDLSIDEANRYMMFSQSLK